MPSVGLRCFPAAATAWFLTALAAPALACDVAASTPHTTDAAEQKLDHAPPSAPTVGVSVVRGRGPTSNGCMGGSSATSCDDVGQIALRVAATDDRTDAAHMGYRVELASGALPAGTALPADAVRPFGDTIYLTWIDGAHDEQEAFAFTLRLTAVDLAGNAGAASLVDVHDGGSSSGCAMTHARPAGWWMAVVPAAAFAVRRRRRG